MELQIDLDVVLPPDVSRPQPTRRRRTWAAMIVAVFLGASSVGILIAGALVPSDDPAPTPREVNGQVLEPAGQPSTSGSFRRVLDWVGHDSAGPPSIGDVAPNAREDRAPLPIATWPLTGHPTQRIRVAPTDITRLDMPSGGDAQGSP